MRKYLIIVSIIGISILLISSNVLSVDQESKLLIKLQKNPNDVKTMRKLAYNYYRWEEYAKAEKYYLKLKELNEITEKDTYYLSLSGVNLPGKAKEYWEKIYDLRNSKVVKYHRFSHIINYSIPLHWVPINDKYNKNSKVYFNDKLVPAKSILKKKNFLIDNSFDDGLIYCAPDFIIKYKIELPKACGSAEDEDGFFDYYYTFSTIDILIKNLVISEKRFIRNNKKLNGYLFVRDRNYEIVKKEFKSYFEGLDDYSLSAGYLIYTRNLKDIECKYISGIIRVDEGMKLIEFRTYFPVELSEQYLKELDTFLISLYSINKK